MAKEEDKTAGRGPNPIDTHVGSRIRLRRKTLGISQEKLADQLGLTFQQVQKYERGANRVSASKLYEIARALQSSIAFFFEGLADPMGESSGVAEAPRQFVNDFIMTAEGLEMAEAFPRIRKAKARRRVLDLVKTLADDES